LLAQALETLHSSGLVMGVVHPASFCEVLTQVHKTQVTEYYYGSKASHVYISKAASCIKASKGGLRPLVSQAACDCCTSQRAPLECLHVGTCRYQLGCKPVLDVSCCSSVTSDKHASCLPMVHCCTGVSSLSLHASNICFASDAALEGRPLTPLDDWESLGYTLLWMATGSLPWSAHFSSMAAAGPLTSEQRQQLAGWRNDLLQDLMDQVGT
jgi:hypothetical protein